MKEKKPLSVIAGDNARRLMKERHLTQERLAELLSANRGLEKTDARTVRQWLSHGIVKIDTVEAVATALGVSLWELLSKQS